MPRPLRIHFPGAFYHVTLRGNHRQAIFRTHADRLLLNAIVAAAIEKHSARVHAYCWMSNHIHLLLQVGAEPLGVVMRDIASGYARAFQRKLETTGHLFERRYHAILVDADSYLLELVRYIHLNPVTARIAAAVHVYRWSSHHAYAGLGVDRWVTNDFALRMFNERRDAAVAAYRRFVSCDPALIPSPFAEIRNDEFPVLGDDAFLARIARLPARGACRETLDSLLAEACAQFSVSLEDLRSLSRARRLVYARGWIARAAVERGVASLSAVARMLGKERSTLRYAMQCQRALSCD